MTRKILLLILSFSLEQFVLSFVGKQVYHGEATPPPNYSKKFTVSHGWETPILDYFADYESLRSHKHHTRALLCGSGPSVADIGPEAAAYLKRHFDIWSSNQFFVHHHLVADFFHVEFKASAFGFWDRHFMRNSSKIQQYQDANTYFLYEDKKMFFEYMRKFVNRTGLKAFGFHPRGIDLLQPDVCGSKDGEYIPRRYPLTKKCSASTTLLLDMMKSMGYSSIWMIGIDMKSSAHFWNDRHDYPGDMAKFRPQQWPMPHTRFTVYENGTDKQGKRKVKDLHRTHERGFTEFAPAFIRYNNITTVNLSPQSADMLPFLHVRLDEIFAGTKAPEYYEALSKRVNSKCSLPSCLILEDTR